MTDVVHALRFLRKQARFSFRTASIASGMTSATINHLEPGRIQIHKRHLEKLLAAYGVTIKTFEMLSSGTVPLPQDLRFECIALVRLIYMPLKQLRTAHPVLLSLAAQMKKVGQL